ncbi:MAG: tripartite tricarboxylate transporter TctB family protein, partial [Geminicoccaceae bacterium]
VLCCGLYYVTTSFPEPPLFLGENVLPAEFPRLLLWIIGILALTLPFEHLLEKKRHPMIRKSRSAPIGWAIWATIGLLLIILLLAPAIGMIATILVSSLAIPVLWGERRWVPLILYAVAFTALVTYIFAVVLRVYFEPGLFGLTIR